MPILGEDGVLRIRVTIRRLVPTQLVASRRTAPSLQWDQTLGSWLLRWGGVSNVPREMRQRRTQFPHKPSRPARNEEQGHNSWLLRGHKSTERLLL